MLFHATIKNTYQPLIKRAKAVLLLPIVAGTLLLSACSDEETAQQPPVAKVSLPKNPTQDYDYLLNGVQIDDNYMWLEQKTPQRTNWIEQQRELSEQYFSRLDQSIDDAKQGETLFNRRLPQQLLDRYFYIKENLSNQQNSIAVFDTIKEVETDLGAIPDGLKAVSTSLSPQGRFLAIQTQNRQQQFRWLLFDLASRQFNSYRLPLTKIKTDFNWLAGYNRFIYQTDHQVYYQNLGQGPEFSRLLFDFSEQLEDTEQWHINAKLTTDTRYLLITAKHLVDTSDMIWVIPMDESGQLGKAVNIAKNTRANLNFVGNINDTFYFHTNLVAPRWRIISINLKQPSRRDWKEVIGQQNELLLDAQLIDNRWLLQYLDNTQQKLYLSQLNGSSKQSIKVSANSHVELQPAHYMLNGQLSSLVTVNSFLHPSSIFSLSLDDRQLVAEPLPLTQLDDIKVETVFYRSADGSRIPLTIAHQERLSRNGNNPALIITNQGFGHIQMPYYHPIFNDWLERGGIIAIAHIRGGGVYGESWRQSVAGQKHARAVEDIIAAVDWLANNNYSNRKQTAAFGEGFAGSLIMEAAIHAPQNFRALALNNIEANYLSFLESENPFWMKEFMLKNDQASTEWFLAVSPYHRLTVKNYPAILIIDDNNEPEVSNYKTLAKWQNMQLSQRPVLLLNKEMIEDITDETNFSLITQEAVKQFLSNELRASAQEQEEKPASDESPDQEQAGAQEASSSELN